MNEKSFVVEVASNDGYLLQYFVRENIPVLGIEPAANVAKVASEKGVPTLVRFFGATWRASLLLRGKLPISSPEIMSWRRFRILNDFVEGLRIVLKPEGVLTLEFPHLLRLMERNEFDTIYHEHFSYFSLLTTVQISGTPWATSIRCRRTCLHMADRYVSMPAVAESRSHPDAAECSHGDRGRDESRFGHTGGLRRL